jgi:hypothetical protein
MFRTDPEKIGETEKWFAESPKRSPWRAISTHDFWDKLLGTRKEPHYTGDAWYAVDLIIPPADGKKVFLHFGAVDENYTLWVNGRYISDNLAAGTTVWDQPVSVEITGKYNEGQSNHVVVRVKNTLSAGGIWKPVALLVAESTFYEGFEYTTGTSKLIPQGGWRPQDVSPHANFDVTPASLSYTDGDGDVLVTSGHKASKVTALRPDYGRDALVTNDFKSSPRSDGVRPLGPETTALFGTTQTIYASVLWQNHGDLNFKGGGSGSLNISAGANAANAAIRASLGDIDGSTGGLVYGTAIPYGTSRFLGIKIDNSAAGNETVTIIQDPDLSNPNWDDPDITVSGKDIGAPNMVRIGTRGDQIEPPGVGLAIDEIRIGVTWADVAPIVPEPAASGSR